MQEVETGEVKGNESQSSSQCHKRFTGLYLQVCKTGLFLIPFVAASIDGFNKIMLFSTSYLKVKMNMS